MYKIAVMGDRDSVYGFAALGLEVFPLEEGGEDPARLLRRLAEGDYAVIYITEALEARIEQEVDRWRTEPLPAIITIPGVSGNTGRGIRMVKRSVEQAVGSDIIFGNG